MLLFGVNILDKEKIVILRNF